MKFGIVILFLCLVSCSNVYKFSVINDTDDNVCFNLSVSEDKGNTLYEKMKSIAKDREENMPRWLVECSFDYYADYSFRTVVNSKIEYQFNFIKEKPFSVSTITKSGETEYISVEEFFTKKEKEVMYKMIPEWRKKLHRRENE